MKTKLILCLFAICLIGYADESKPAPTPQVAAALKSADDLQSSIERLEKRIDSIISERDQLRQQVVLEAQQISVLQQQRNTLASDLLDTKVNLQISQSEVESLRKQVQELSEKKPEAPKK